MNSTATPAAWPGIIVAWASDYDLDVSREGYCGPKIVAQLAGAMQTAYLGRERAAISILDAGCGTGLLGV